MRVRMLGLLKRSRFPAFFISTTTCRSYCTNPSRTAVLSFGDGSNGALGLSSSFGDDAYEPTPISGLPPDISSLAAGHYHSLAVTHGGEVWAWGRNEECQLGRGASATRNSWNQPKRVNSLDKVGVRAVFASAVVSAAIGDDGSLWIWGKSKRGQLGLGQGVTESVVPSRVEALSGEDIVKVSLGWGHALAQTRDGKLFGWGYSAGGRLGEIMGSHEASIPPITNSSISRATRGSNSTMEVAEKAVLEQMGKETKMPIVWEPRLVQELHGRVVLDIACGLDHSLVLCDDGTLFSCGDNTYGQLGRPTDGSKLLPIDMSFRPVSLASGLGHSLAVCQIPSPEDAREDSCIISWGWNCSSQLGRQGPEDSPRMVEGLEGERPVSVSGGRVHSIALTSTGEVWAWGSGRNGRLGLGSSSDEAKPTLLEYLDGSEVLQAATGFDHNLLLVAQ